MNDHHRLRCHHYRYRAQVDAVDVLVGHPSPVHVQLTAVIEQRSTHTRRPWDTGTYSQRSISVLSSLFDLASSSRATTFAIGPQFTVILAGSSASSSRSRT